MRCARLLAPLLALVLQPSLASASSAGGVAIRWDQCYGDAGVQNKNFACDTNAGSETLVGSFVPTADIVNVSGIDIVIDMASSSGAWPQWWQFKNIGYCRRTSLSMVVAATGTNCPDWAAGYSTGGIGAYNIGQRGPNTARAVMAVAVDPQHLQNLLGLSEYFAFKLVIDNVNTVGTGACAGCTTPVCILLKSMDLTTQILTNHRLLTGPANGTDSDFALWQGGGNPTVGGNTGCPAATPTAKRTWGAVKALYR